ncbi:MAG TPA: hypothetical protein VH024_17705 [Candidatus Angelobacter sp.]|nr:hypothetical protein [Candidatus Angelobacter sp.]
MFPHRLHPWRLFARFLLSAALLAGAGCGGSSSNNCKVTALNVTPSSMTVNHTAAPPANSQVFTSTDLFTGNGVCTANTAAAVSSNWTASDPSIHLSASPTTQVTATCTATLINPAIIRAVAASDQTLTGQASLTCQ